MQCAERRRKLPEKSRRIALAPAPEVDHAIEEVAARAQLGDERKAPHVGRWPLVLVSLRGAPERAQVARAASRALPAGGSPSKA